MMRSTVLSLPVLLEFHAYADVVSLQEEGFDGGLLAGGEPEDLVVAPVPLDRIEPLVLQGEGTLEHWALPLLRPSV
jgi:hypothetical protein